MPCNASRSTSTAPLSRHQALRRTPVPQLKPALWPPAATRLPRTRRPSRNHPLLSPMAGEVRIQRARHRRHPSGPATGAFLKREDLPNGSTLGLFAIRAVHIGEQPLFVIGGERLDQQFPFDARHSHRHARPAVPEPRCEVESATAARPERSRCGRRSPCTAHRTRCAAPDKKSRAAIHWSGDAADAEIFHAIPLDGPGQHARTNKADSNSWACCWSAVRGVRSSNYNGSIISTAMLVGGCGILVAVLTSLWFAARVTRPVVSLADAARRVAAGDLAAKVEVESRDELGELAASFNRMTEDLAPAKRSRRASRAGSGMARTGAPPGA